MGLIGMAQVLATLAYGITGLRGKPRGTGPPLMRIHSRLMRAKWTDGSSIKPPHGLSPACHCQPVYDSRSKMTKSMRYRLILTKSSDYNWLMQDRHALRDLRAVAADGRNHWVPQQDLPFEETILFAYAADHSTRPTYVCLPSGLHNARTGRVLQPAGPYREVLPLPGILFFDAWRVEPTLDIPSTFLARKTHLKKTPRLRPPPLPRLIRPGRAKKRLETYLPKQTKPS